MKYLKLFEKRKWIKDGNVDLEEVRFIFDPLFDIGFRGYIRVEKSPEGASYHKKNDIKIDILRYCNGYIHIGLKFSDPDINLNTTKRDRMMRFQDDVNDILSEIHDRLGDTKYSFFNEMLTQHVRSNGLQFDTSYYLDYYLFHKQSFKKGTKYEIPKLEKFLSYPHRTVGRS